ncbi:MAG: ABC transporter permease [Acidobacteria bacterium]|nr:ABC transporter permease [Acidobacteriota bacterium]
MQAILAIFYREYKIRATNMVWLFYDLCLPLGYLLIFGLGFTRVTQDQILWADARLSYSAFFLGGVLAMSGFGIAIGTAWAFFTDRDNGIFYEFLTYPLGSGEFLIGKVLFNILLSAGQAALSVAAAAALLDVPIRLDLLPLLLLAMAVGTAGWFFFLSLFALRIRRNDVFNTIMNIFYFFLLFASSMFYPVEPLPAWLRVLAYVNPLTWQADFLRYASLGVGGGGGLALEAALFCVFTLVSFWAATRTLERME